MFLNDILGDMYAEKIIMMKSRYKPESYMIMNDLKGQIEETMNEASRLLKIERNECIQRLHDKDKIAP